MKKNVLIALAISAMLLASCKKEDPEVVPTTEAEVETHEPQSPIPLKVGNEWVYDVYKVRYDISGNIVSETLEQTDTLTIVRKEVVGSHEYFVVNRCLTCGIPQNPSSQEEYLRVENGRLVGPKFKPYYSIHPSSEPLDSFFVDSFVKRIYFINNYEDVVSVPAGNFDDVIETLGETYYYNNSENRYIRYENNNTQSLYLPQIGLLSDKVYYANRTNGYRRELVSYTLN